MTDDEVQALRFKTLDDRIAYVRGFIANAEKLFKESGSFAMKLHISSMKSHLADLEAQAAERDARIRAEMEGPHDGRIAAEFFEAKHKAEAK